MFGKYEEFISNNNNSLINCLILYKKDLSRKRIKQLLKNEMIMVNDKVVTNANFIVKNGDKICISYSKKVIKDYDLKILYEDDDIIAISKKSGLLSISNDKEKDITAFKMVRSYVRKNNPNTYLFAIHRLDEYTSGVLIFGKNQKIKDMLQDNWNNIVKKRGYYAIIPGKLSKSKGTIRSYLKENMQGFICSSKNNDGKLAITNYCTVKSNDKYSLLEINIKTGRRNQIRVHLSEMGYPIIGDKKYGSKDNSLGRLGLHAYELSFIDPRSGKVLTIKDEIPQVFVDVF